MKNNVSELNDCDCCQGVTSQTPVSTANPPGMPALNYRAGTHARFKETMLSQLSRQPSLRSLHTRKDDDPTIALINAWATVLDVLTFYQERIANEGYLLTATERRSILELARQIGYELAPGIAAETHLAFLMEAAPGAPASARIAAGTRAQNQPDQDAVPQSFETAVDITARPERNRLRPQMFEPQKIFGEELYLDGIDLNLNTGDVLLFINEEAKKDDPNSKKWEIRRLTEVDINPTIRQTRVAWKTPVNSTDSEITTNDSNDPIKVFVFRQRASIFGQNAPDWKTYPDEAKATYLGLDDPKNLTKNEKIEWPGFEIFAPKYPLEVHRVWPGTYLVQPTTESVFNVAVEVADAAVKSALLEGISVIPESMFETIKHLLLAIAATVDVGNQALTSTGSVIASEFASLGEPNGKVENLRKSLTAYFNPVDAGNLSAESENLIKNLTEFLNSSVPIIPIIENLTQNINFADIIHHFDQAKREIESIPIEITEAIGKAILGLCVSMSVKTVMKVPLPFEKKPEIVAFVAVFVAKVITTIIDFDPEYYQSLKLDGYSDFFTCGCDIDILFNNIKGLNTENWDGFYDELNSAEKCTLEDFLKALLFLTVEKDFKVDENDDVVEGLRAVTKKAIDAVGSDNLIGLTSTGAAVALGAGAAVGAGAGATAVVLPMSYFTLAVVLVPIIIPSLGALIIAVIVLFIYRNSISKGANSVARDICNAVIAACNPEVKNHPDRRPRLKLSDNMIDLDTIYPKISAKSWMLLSLPDSEEVYCIDNVNEAARSEFTLNSKTTRVTLQTGDKDDGEAFYKISDQALYTLRDYVDNDELSDNDPPGQVLNEFIKMLESQKGKVFIPGKSKFEKIIITFAAEVATRFSVELEEELNKKLTETINKVVENGKCNNLEDKFTNKENTDTVRMTAAFAESEELPIALQPWAEDIIGVGENSILLSHLIQGLASGCQLIISGLVVDSTEKASQLVRVTNSCFVERTAGKYKALTSVEAVDFVKQHPEKIFTKIFFAPVLKHSLQRKSVEIFANVTRAVHGETRNVIQGSGDASIINQQFELKEIPLTYVSSTDGAGSTLQVRVNDVLWQEVRTLYDAPGSEKVYTTSMDNHGQVTIQFGDGINGARLPTGVDNVTARYRVGSGSDGMVAAGKINMLISRPPGVNGVTNPLPSAGAADPEKIEAARKNAPLTVLTIDRIVSLQDYEDFARAFPGIGKAQARPLWDGQKEIVHLTIAPAVGDVCDEDSPLSINLRNAVRTHSDNMQSFEVQCFEKVEFDVAARIKFDYSYEEERVFRDAKSALKTSFSFDAREFGRPVTSADIIVVFQSVTGVTAVDLDKLAYTSDPDTPLHRLLAKPARRDEAGQIKSGQLLVLNPDGLNLTMGKQLI